MRKRKVDSLERIRKTHIDSAKEHVKVKEQILSEKLREYMNSYGINTDNENDEITKKELRKQIAKLKLKRVKTYAEMLISELDEIELGYD